MTDDQTAGGSAALSSSELTLLDLAVLGSTDYFPAEERTQWADVILGAARETASNSRLRPVITAIVALARQWRDGQDGTRHTNGVRVAVECYFRERYEIRKRKGA